MSPEDHETLELLEVLSLGSVPLPQDLQHALQEAGFIEPAGTQYRLTMSGSLRLENLRSLSKGPAAF
jgi:hypothetical protein